MFTARLFFLSILLQGNIFIDSSVKVGELFGLLKFKTSFNILSRDVLLPSLTRKFLLHRDVVKSLKPFYAAASLSPAVKQALYPSLKRQIKGKATTEAANLLLNFVQTAFDYQTDGEQFGAERTLFADESLYYPYCDCEDRSILYANLVHDLLGLDVVLLHYPGHLATAVRFPDELPGNYVLLEGIRYLVCDPTYIGADIGMAMPKYRNSKVEVKTIW